MTLIAAGAAVLDGRVCRPGWVQTSGTRLLACGPGTPPHQADVDFPDGVVVPGFVDIHVHGGGGASYTSGIAADVTRAAEFHLRHGTTTTIASLLTASPEELIGSVRGLADMARRGTIAGIHLEGPWLSPMRCGAHDQTKLRDPDPAEVDAVLAAGQGAIRMVTLAPERCGASAAIEHFVDAGVVVALGHTDATYEQTRRAIALGATVGTHLFNGMRPWHHREPGPALALLEDPRVTVELIADGIHLHPAVVHRVMDTAGSARVTLITDASAAAGMTDGSVRFGALDIDVVCGVAQVRGTSTIAGSTVTMEQLFRTAVQRPGPTPDQVLADAVEMTSTTPARTLGLHQVGALRPGLDADLVVLDSDLRIAAIMADGDWQPA